MAPDRYSGAWRHQITMVLVGFVMSMTAPIELLYAVKFGLGPLLVTTFIIVSAIGVVAVDVLGTRVVTRMDARTLMIVSMILFGFSESGYALAHTPSGLIAARLLQGAASAAMAGGALQLTVRVADSTTRALGSVQSLQLLGGAAGAPFGGFLASQVHGLAGYRLAFVACSGSGLLVAIAVRVVLPCLPAVDRTTPRIGLPNFVVPQAARLVLALGLFGNYLCSGVENTAFPLIGDKRGLTPAEIGLALGTLAVVEIFVLATSGRLFERLSAARCLAVALR